MATKEEVEQALLDAIESLAKKSQGQAGSNLTALGQTAQHFAETRALLRSESS